MKQPRQGVDSSRADMKRYDPRKNVSSQVMSKYERSAIIGMRIEQLARGATPFVTLSEEEDARMGPEEIAERELVERRVPFILKRTLPNGMHEFWRIEDMIIP